MSFLKGLSPENMAQSMGSCISGLTFPLLDIPYCEIAFFYGADERAVQASHTKAL